MLAIAQAAEDVRYPIFRRALIYPTLVLLLSLLVLCGFALIVVPPFESMFEEFGLSLRF